MVQHGGRQGMAQWKVRQGQEQEKIKAWHVRSTAEGKVK